MRIVLAGGTGFIGKRVIERLSGARHDVVVLTRNPAAVNAVARPNLQAAKWDGKLPGAWYSHVDGADAVINFAGESIGATRWSSKQKDKILNSRIDATRAIIESMNRAKKKPRVFVSASAVGYYGHVESVDVLESHPRGSGFLSDVCETWEREARVAEQFGVRVVMTRAGVVLGSGGGALQRMALPFKLCVGGTLGSGTQWFPWVHIDDVVEAILFAIESKTLSGPVNLAASESVTMRQFTDALGQAMRRPSWAPVPGFVLKLILGEMSSMILTGQKVVPAKLLEHGYSFRYPRLDGALANIFL